MIRIKRVYEKAAKEDGWRVLVDRLWPRGVKKESARIDLWMKDVAPSDALRKWFGHDPKRWPEFKKRYRRELEKKRALLRELGSIEKKHGTLTLLFGAKDEKHNQAAMLTEVLNSGWKGAPNG